jgi:hypothetical protein
MRRRTTVLAVVAAIATSIGATEACSSFDGDDDVATASDGGNDGGLDALVAPADGSLDALTASDSTAPVPVVLAGGFNNLQGIAATDSTVYVVSNSDGKVYSGPLAGGAFGEFASSGDAPSAIVVLEPDVIWSALSARMLHRKAIAGGGIATLTLPNNLSPGALAVAGPNLLAVAAYVESTNQGDVLQFTRDFVLVATTGKGPFLTPFDVAVSGNVLWWTESGAQKIWSAGAGDAGANAILSSENDCQSIAADALGVYWARQVDSVVRAALSSPTRTVDLATGEKLPFSLAADGLFVYWLTADGKLRRAERTGAMAVTLAEGFASPSSALRVQAIALTGKYIVWITSDGKVLRLEK